MRCGYLQVELCSISQLNKLGKEPAASPCLVACFLPKAGAVAGAMEGVGVGASGTTVGADEADGGCSSKQVGTGAATGALHATRSAHQGVRLHTQDQAPKLPPAPLPHVSLAQLDTCKVVELAVRHDAI
eukprot:4789835-Amphidinium_carterae.1